MVTQQQSAKMFDAAVAHCDAEQWSDALALLDTLIGQHPAIAELYSNRGRALLGLGLCEEAERAFERAVRLGPGNAAMRNIIGVALQKAGSSDAALAHYDAAIAIDPALAFAHFNRATIVEIKGLLRDAAASYENAIKFRPAYIEAISNLGVLRHEMQDFDGAIAAFDCAIALQPRNCDLYCNRAFTRLLTGNYEKGFRDYAWRLPKLKDAAPVMSAPIWKGEPLAGKTILLHAEQGLGDCIQFSRYALALKAQGAKVILSVPEKMTRLFGRLGHGIAVVASGGKTDCDYECLLMNLPGIMGVPAGQNISGYLAAETDLVQAWAARIGGHGYRVGIAWEGDEPSGHPRRIPLAAFGPLAGLPGVRLISLQKFKGEEQIDQVGADFAVERLDGLDESGDAFVDTAAAMASLDLVITSDTSIAHLAGALGHPVWIGLRQVPDWRWRMGASGTPWYPTARLFRQRQRGDWNAVMDDMAKQLKPMLPD
jgi:tetratricopeptide (TPR) repeat protein